jgi:hypothetical protein
MMRLEVDQASFDAAEDHLESIRLNILAGIRSSMMEGMQGLAGAVGEKLQGNPIAERTGDLLRAVMASPRVVETATYIKGEVSTTSAKFRNLGLWLNFGTKFPTKGNTGAYPKQFLHSFAPANSKSIAKNGHGAFRIEPTFFFTSTFEDFSPTILEGIYQRIAEACNE